MMLLRFRGARKICMGSPDLSFKFVASKAPGVTHFNVSRGLHAMVKSSTPCGALNHSSLLTLCLDKKSSFELCCVCIGAKRFSTTPMYDSAPLSGINPSALVTSTEPTFISQGLAHSYPSGWLQAVMEMVHIDVGLPWWATIVSTTFMLRLLMFPVVIKSQRNMVKINNFMPEMNKRQAEMMTATKSEELIRKRLEYGQWIKDKGVNPLATYFPMLGQGFVFASMFFALRGMANCPVESMKLGGLGWFVDLCVADPFFLLPVVTSASAYLHIKLGAEGLNLNTTPPILRNILLALPIISLPVMCQFPAALNLYWLTTNWISICQARFVRHPKVRKLLGIDEMIVWSKEELDMSHKKVSDGYKQVVEDIIERKKSKK